MHLQSGRERALPFKAPRFTTCAECTFIKVQCAIAAGGRLQRAVEGAQQKTLP